jgi:hypothetical protein
LLHRINKALKLKTFFNLIVILLIGSQYAFAQNSEISGKVLDSRTLEPLPFANVYINNTTIGATTNPAGEFLIKNVPLGFSELVFSYVGYQTYQVKINVSESKLIMGVIKLLQAEAQLSDVEIKVKRDNTWEKQLKRFEKIFIGEGQLANNCKIINPWAIDFTDDGKTFMAKAILPLEIENRKLGYKLFFQLKDFKSSSDRYSIVGNTRFEEMTTMDAKIALQWMRNREEVYLGSIRHLMKSILEKKIAAEGFRLYAEKVSGKVRSTNFSHELEHNLLPYDTSDIIKTLAGENRIFFKDKIEVHYISELNKYPYYKDISHAVSWVEIKNGYIKVNNDGTLLNAAEVIISGDMSKGRVATLLPLDYQRGRIIKIQSRPALVAKRLQEKVYLQTDKPYYYPGENIWFSGYMNYRVPAVRDTLSKVLHVELINKSGDLVKSLTLEIDSGRLSGNIRLPEKMQEGSYLLMAYTQWMRNYGDDYVFYKPVSILNLLDKVQASEKETFENVSQGLEITFDKPFFKKREKISLTIASQDKNDSIKTTLSISVTDAQQVIRTTSSHSILDDYPFEEEMPAGMLPVFKFPIERGISVKGIYRNKKGKPEQKDLTIVQDGFTNIFQVRSDDKGNFAIHDLAFYDTLRFAIQSGTGTVALKKEESHGFSKKYFAPDLLTVRMSTPQRIFSTYDASDAILLKEVEVVGERIENEPKYENPYGKPDLYLKGESIKGFASVAEAIVAKMPGFKLISYEGQRFLIWARGEFTRVRAPSEPVVYINGSQLNSNGTVGERLFELNPALIDHIEVSSMISTNLGATGANGLIAVFTKRAEDPKFKGLPLFKVKGYDTQSEFRSPDYENTFTDSSLADYRSTLYWNPWVDLNEKDKTEISFFASDLEGEYRVVVEGVTATGKPVRAVAYVHVAN